MKRFISGFLLGALIFAVPTLANNSKTLQAFYNDIKISIYGQIVDPQGNEPFIVEGRTYVPARFVAEAMGGVVKWNAETNTVEVVKPETPAVSKLTSDGLEAVYSYYLKGYCLEFSQIRDKYYTAFDYNVSPNLDEIIYFERSNPSNKITAKIIYDNGAIIMYEEYENVLLPFLRQYFK